MEGGSHHRQKDFKTGLGDTEAVVARHAEKAVSLRKDKREEKRRQFRTTGPTPEGFTHDKLVVSAMAARQEFIQTGSLEALQFLQKFFRCMNEKEINNLLDNTGDLVKALIMVLTKSSPVHTLMAMDCLVNITGSIDVLSKLNSVDVILNKTPFLEIAFRHLHQKDSPIRLDMWMCIGNISCTCQDARDRLFNSAIFQYNSAVPIFAAEFERRDPAILPIIILITYKMCADKNAVVNERFILENWSRIVNLLYETFPAPQKEEPGDLTNDILECLLEIIEGCLYKTTDEFALRLLYAEKPLIPFMVKLCTRVRLINQIHAARIVSRMGYFRVPKGEFLHLQREAGCIQVMTQFSWDSNERLQRESMVWLAYYAAYSSEFVSHLLQSKALDGIIEFFRRSPKASLLDQAIFVFCAACQSCYQNQTHKKESGEILKDLLMEKGCLRLMCHHVGQTGKDKMTIDILTLWSGLLKWNRSFVFPYLQEIGGIDKVERLLGSNNTAIYKIAEKIIDFVQSHEVETETEMDMLDE